MTNWMHYWWAAKVRKVQKVLGLLKREKTKRTEISYDWLKVARPSQLPPEGNWSTWLILAGRGFGKTRTGSETINAWVRAKKAHRIALIGASIHEVLNVMINGESGIRRTAPLKEQPKWNSATNTLHFPNGALCYVIGAETPEKLRGPQFDAAWIDEFAKFRCSKEIWTQLMMSLRLGEHPRCIITTTPRPSKLIEEIMQNQSTVVTRGTTFDNKDNLAKSFLTQVQKQFEGTALGAQELYGEILDSCKGALWNRDLIRYAPIPTDIRRIVVAIDPAATNHQDSDETGIVVVALGEDQKLYVLEDLSGRLSPLEWGQRAVQAYFDYKADRIVAEINKGGDMVERIIKSIDPHIAYKSVRATRGKGIRAEPVAALYEQRRVFHQKHFKELEEQLCTYIPGVTSKSPDRLDALVWAITELALDSEANPVLRVW